MSAHDNIGLLLRYVACTIQGIEIRFHIQTISNLNVLSSPQLNCKKMFLKQIEKLFIYNLFAIFTVNT